MSGYRIICGGCLDVLRGMEGESVHCCVTSPPYWGWRGGDAGCESIGVELNPSYVDLAHARMRQHVLDLVGT
jgi:hypothetical protein